MTVIKINKRNAAKLAGTGSTPTKKKKKKHPLQQMLCDEFSAVGKSCQVMRRAFYTLLDSDAECKRTGELMKRLMEIMHTDMNSDIGKRRVEGGDLSLLEGFSFNRRQSLQSIFPFSVIAAINPTTGICTVSLPAMVPAEKILRDSNYTHMKVVVAAACLNFSTGKFSNNLTISDYVDARKECSINLCTMIDVEDRQPIVLLLGVQFYKKVNNHYALLYSKGSIVLDVVKTAIGSVED